MQADFRGANSWPECRKLGLKTALDTCGQYPWEKLESLLPLLDLLLYDLKEIDPERHREFTGHGNDLIQANLLQVRDWIKARPGRMELWIRTPIIPGSTAREDNLAGLSRFIGDNLTGLVSRWELCAFNNLCRDKYLRLGLDWVYQDTPLMTESRLEELTAAARCGGAPPEIVHWTGSARLEEKPTPEEEKKLRLVKGACPA